MLYHFCFTLFFFFCQNTEACLEAEEVKKGKEEDPLSLVTPSHFSTKKVPITPLTVVFTIAAPCFGGSVAETGFMGSDGSASLQRTCRRHCARLQQAATKKKQGERAVAPVRLRPPRLRQLSRLHNTRWSCLPTSFSSTRPPFGFTAS